MVQTAPKRPRSAGALLALAIVVGTVIGIFKGESSAGFLAGLAAGIVIAVLVWLLDRRQRS